MSLVRNEEKARRGRLPRRTGWQPVLPKAKACQGETVSGILCLPMPLSRQQAKAQNGRIRLAVAALVMASALGSIGGGEISGSDEGARVEINGGRKKDAAVLSERARRKSASVEI